MMMSKATFGAGLAGSVFNLGLLSRLAGANPLLVLPAIAGVIGIVALGFRKAWGILLVLVGFLPGLAVLLAGAAQGPRGLLYTLPFLVPTLIVAGALAVDGMSRARKLTLRCARCGVEFTPYPDAWNDAGFCSRKCGDDRRRR